MKLCACCHTRAPDSATTCRACGEASWRVERQPVPPASVPEAPVSEPVAFTPPVPQVSEPAFDFTERVAAKLAAPMPVVGEHVVYGRQPKARRSTR